MAGGGGSSNQTTTTTPPPYQLPSLQYGVNQAGSLYSSGQYAPVTPFSPQTEEALSGIQQRAEQGSPVSNAANSYVTNTLNGSNIGGNPQLDNMFNRAAQQTQGQLATQFGSAGRNVDASEGLRSQQLNDLATQIYGGAYNTGVQQQMSALPYANPTANQGYTDLNALLGVGQSVDSLAGAYANQPANALNSYLQSIQGTGQGYGTSTTPNHSNSATGALGGLASGASLGSMFGPWGALIGGAAGGLLGGFG